MECLVYIEMQHLSDRMIKSTHSERKALQMFRKFSQLSYHERMVIERGILADKSRKDIVGQLKRPKSCISREILRNSDDQNRYIELSMLTHLKLRRANYFFFHT